MSSYSLFQALVAHESDVRGLCVCDLGIVTTSRDKTARIWTENASKKYSEALTLVGHTNYVGPAIRFPPGLSPQLPNGAIVTGSRDTTVIVWDPVTGDKIHELAGHQYQVAALTIALDGYILSASLDKTIRAWKDGECVQVLEGHEGPVLSLLTLPTGDVLSGSGDTTIRRWSAQSGQCVATYKGHTDSVRALALLPDVGFVSASHDQTLKVWTLDGEVVSELLGHTAIIYAVAATDSGLIASGSEDGTVRLWHADGSCVQNIPHPGCVWDVAFTPAQDLVSGCSDGVAYVWSASADKPADAEAVKAFEDAIAARSKSEEESAKGGAGGAQAALPPGLKVDEKYVLLERGSKDGETKVVRESDGSVWAYSWNLGALEWEKIGEVVPAPAKGAAAKDGTWDYSFDVDISDGAPTKRLSGNYNENPYDVADRFLEQEGLPGYFRDQVVSFILQNTQGRAAPDVSNLPVTGGFCDPYTGGRPSEAAPPPFRPPASTSTLVPMDVTGGGVDPFTGGSSRSSGSSMANTSQYIPYRGYMLFDSPPPVAALSKKLLEFNTALQQAGQPEALSEEEMGACQSLLSTLTPSPSSTALPPSALSLLPKLLSFPKANLFLVFDIIRTLILDQTLATSLSMHLGSLSSPAPRTLAGALATATSDPPSTPAQQTGTRLICNCFKHEALREWATANIAGLLDLLGSASSSANKHVRQATATALLNFAVLVTGGKKQEEEVQLQLMGAVSELLGTEGVMQETDTAFRALAAAGTLASTDKEMAALARDLGLDGIARQLMAQPGASPKLVETARAVVHLLSQ